MRGEIQQHIMARYYLLGLKSKLELIAGPSARDGLS